MAKKLKKKSAKKKAKRKVPKKTGRKTKYKPQYCQKIIDFFDIETTREVEVKTTFKNGTVKETTEERANHLPFFSNFAHSIGTTDTTIVNWTKKYPEFLAAYTRAKALQKQHLITCGLLGLYNAAFAKFTAINITDMRDEQNLNLGGSVAVNFNITKNYDETS